MPRIYENINSAMRRTLQYGFLKQDSGDDGYSRFQYFPEFAKHGVEIAPFAMPLSKGNARLIVDEIKSILLDLGFAGGFL